MTLAEIAEELRLLAGELKGHDEVDQWIRLDALADELVKEHRFIISRANALGKRVLAAEQQLEQLRSDVA